MGWLPFCSQQACPVFWLWPLPSVRARRLLSPWLLFQWGTWLDRTLGDPQGTRSLPQGPAQAVPGAPTPGRGQEGGAFSCCPWGGGSAVGQGGIFWGRGRNGGGWGWAGVSCLAQFTCCPATGRGLGGGWDWKCPRGGVWASQAGHRAHLAPGASCQLSLGRPDQTLPRNAPPHQPWAKEGLTCCVNARSWPAPRGCTQSEQLARV